MCLYNGCQKNGGKSSAAKRHRRAALANFWCPRGTRIPPGSVIVSCGSSACETESKGASSIASLNSDESSLELASVVHAWPKLSTAVRNAFLTLIRAAEEAAHEPD